MSDEAQIEFEFEGDSDDEEQADIYVTETFENSYGDQRAVLDGDTYEAKEIIKFDWETTHHSFDDQRKAWVVDEDALVELTRRLTEEGYSVDFRKPENQDDPDLLDVMDALTEVVQDGDHIEVTYEMKNGNGLNTYEGEVVSSKRVYTGKNTGYDMETGKAWGVVFEDTDGKVKRVKGDDNGVPSLFSGGYHPFMGTVVNVVVTAGDGREIERPEIEEESQAEQDEDLPAWAEGGA